MYENMEGGLKTMEKEMQQEDFVSNTQIYMKNTLSACLCVKKVIQFQHQHPSLTHSELTGTVRCCAHSVHVNRQ